MKMKQKLISLVMSLTMVATSAVSLVPTYVGAEAYVNPSDIYVNNSNFRDVSSGVVGLGITVNDGKPWYKKGSAATQSEIYMEEDGKSFGRFSSDGVKSGVPGEGSWYVYNRNPSKGMETAGYMKFDVRINDGSGPFELVFGKFEDPTKSTSPHAGRLEFNPGTKKLIANTSSGQKKDIYTSLKTNEWYTVEVEFNVKLQEYSVSMFDKDGKELGSEKEMAFVSKDCDKIINSCFGYIRKQTQGHSFDLTNVTISRMSKENTVATQAASAKPTEAPTATPTVAPSTTPTTAPSATPTVAPSAKPASFKDIDTHWAKDQIIEMAAAGVINGMDDTTFAPEQKITRAQFIKLIVATAGLETKDAYAGVATDVKGDWSENFVAAAEKAGLIDASFVVDGKLNPGANITREEMASLVARVATLKKVEMTGTAPTFPDADTISDWAKADVTVAAQLGIVNGMDGGLFAPKEPATRAQAAVMMSRLLAQLK